MVRQVPFAAKRLDERVERVLRAILEEGAATLEKLHLRLCSVDPALAARGLHWLEGVLRRSQVVKLRSDGRFELRAKNGSRLAKDGLEGVRTETVSPPALGVKPVSEYIVLDLETNPDRVQVAEHEIIEIGACRVKGERIVDEFHVLVRPTRQLTAETVKLTGLTDKDLQKGQNAKDALRQFVEFVGALPLVAHNGLAYDFPVLFAAFGRLGLPFFTNDLLDTLDLAHIVFPRTGLASIPNMDGTAPPPNRTLAGLAQHLGLSDNEARHRALGDARLAVRVLAALLEELGRDSSVRELQRWLLHAGRHPWASFVSPPVRRPDLVEVVPCPSDEPPLPPTSKFDVGKVLAAFKRGGVLMQGNRKSRPQQVKMVERVVQALAERARVMIEAPTGTGKTLAYLVPAIEYARAVGRPVLVATFSKVLQNQVLETLCELDAQLGPVRAVLLKGSHNYVDLDRLAAVLEEGPEDGQHALALAVLVGWVAQTPTGDWDDLPVWAIESRCPLPELRWDLRIEVCPQLASSELAERCFYRRALSRLDAAQVAVLNHAVLVANHDGWSRLRPGGLIIDEAHNFEEAATGALSLEITQQWVEYVLSAVYHPTQRRGFVWRYVRASPRRCNAREVQELVDSVESCHEAVSAFGRVLIEYVREHTGARKQEAERFGTSYRLRRAVDMRRPEFHSVLSTARHLSESFSTLKERLESLEIPETPRPPYRRDRLEEDVARLGRRLDEMAKQIPALLRCKDASRKIGESRGGDEGEWIYVVDVSIEGGEWFWGLRQVPLTVATLLSELWKSCPSLVLTSATLRVGGSFSYLQERLGLESAHPLALPSPFPRLAEQELMVIPDHLPVPRGELLAEFKRESAEEVVRLLTLTSGRGLVLFTSRERLNFVLEHARPILENQQIPLLAQGEGPAPLLVDRMRNEVTTSLLGTRSFWEGVDIPGEALSILVIEKLPFDSPSDPVVSARVEALILRGVDPFSAYILPQAVLRFAQGVGRLIRSETDLGVVVILDKRLRQAGPYRDIFLTSLPGPPRILRPATQDEAYKEIAAHLGIVLDEDLRRRIYSLPTADPWSDLPLLSLVQCRDSESVHECLEELRERFQFSEWRPGQLEVMTKFLAGEDVLAILPTGSGKSITYQVPALVTEGLTLVISPLIALMRDQVESLRGRRLTKIAALYSGMSQSEQEEVLQRARKGVYKLLYVSPERLWSRRFRTALKGIRIARVAVDEAHCVSQWGHSFRPEYTRIRAALKEIARAQRRRPPILALTATATPAVAQDIVRLLQLRLKGNQIMCPPDRPELRYYVEDCADKDDREVQVVRIVEAFRGKAAIVYVPTREDAVRIADMLRAANHLARAYHGGMQSAERWYVEEAFRDGEIDVVVATKAFGLGIDKKDVQLILHLEMPASIEDYIQETGRAARGAIEGLGALIGTCVLLRTPRDCSVHDYFVRCAAPDLEVVRAVWQRMKDRDAYLLPDHLADQTQLDPEDLSVSAGLAVQYLVEAKCLERLEDVAWEGRLWLPADAQERLLAAARCRARPSDQDLLRHGRAVIKAASELGLEYRAPQWSRRLKLPPERLEEVLLELSRRDVLSFSYWKTAWHLRRRADSEPDWAAIAERCERRRAAVRELSRKAREFCLNDRECRRAQMLYYLGAEPPSSCTNCDVCNPELPRPWRNVSWTRAELEQAIPAEAVCLAMLNRLGDHRYSVNTIVRALIGDERVASNRTLRESPWFGRLRLLGKARVREVLESLARKGWVAVETLSLERAFELLPGSVRRTYATVRITDEGRRHA